MSIAYPYVPLHHQILPYEGRDSFYPRMRSYLEILQTEENNGFAVTLQDCSADNHESEDLESTSATIVGGSSTSGDTMAFVTREPESNMKADVTFRILKKEANDENS